MPGSRHFLNDITLAAFEQTDFVSMLKILAQQLGELYASDGCYITLWDEQKRMPVPVAAYGNMSEAYPTMEAEPGDKTLTGSVFRVGHPLAVDDVYNTPYISPRRRGDISHSFSPRITFDCQWQEPGGSDDHLY